MVLKLYVALVIVSGGAAYWTAGVPGLSVVPLEILFWVLANLLGEVLWMPSPGGRGYLSMATAANFASVLILPTPVAIVVTTIAGISADILFRRRNWYKVLFNAGMCSIAVFVSSRVLASLGDVRGGIEHLLSPVQIGVLALSAASYFLLNTWLVTVAIALDQHVPAWRTWRTSFAFGYEFLGSLMLFLLGLYFAVLYLMWGYMSAFMAAITTYFVRDAYCRFIASLDRTPRVNTAS